MKNPYRTLEENPSPEEEIDSEGDVWKAIRHLRLRCSLIDERMLFVMRWMFPTTWGLLLLILATVIAR